MFMKPLASILGALALATPASAAAQAPAGETITMSWAAGPAATTPPYRGSGTGTYTATGAFSDTGRVSIHGQDAAVNSPAVGVLITDRTLTAEEGTAELHCVQIATDFSNPAVVVGSGSCAITGATGQYAGLHGHGTLTSVANLITRTATDTIVLNIS